MIRTILGNIKEDALGITLPHEHICCYSEYVFQMAGNKYLDKNDLVIISSTYLRELKETYGLNTFVL